MTRKTFDQITKTALDDKGMTIKERALFHAFNDNGAVAEWTKATKEIADAVDAGLMRSGAILAYGSLNDYHYEKLMKELMRSKARRFEVDHHVAGLRRDAENARQKAAEARQK